MDWYEETFRVTVVLLTASLALLVPGFAGIGGSLALVLVLVVLGSALFAGREQLAAGPKAVGHDLGYYGQVLWAGPIVGALVVLIALDATTAELQALGGLVGLAGMVNYFLRPVYRAIHSIVSSVTETGR